MEVTNDLLPKVVSKEEAGEHNVAIKEVLKVCFCYVPCLLGYGADDGNRHTYTQYGKV